MIFDTISTGAGLRLVWGRQHGVYAVERLADEHSATLWDATMEAQLFDRKGVSKPLTCDEHDQVVKWFETYNAQLKDKDT